MVMDEFVKGLCTLNVPAKIFIWREHVKYKVRSQIRPIPTSCPKPPDFTVGTTCNFINLGIDAYKIIKIIHKI